MAVIKNFIGAVYYEMGDIQKSKEIIEESTKKLKSSNSLFGVDFYNNIGYVQLFLGSYHDSEKNLLISLNNREKLFGENNYLIAFTHANLGELYAKKGEY